MKNAILEHKGKWEQYLCEQCQQKPTIKRYNIKSFYRKKTKMWLCFWCWQSMKKEGFELKEIK